MNALISCAPSFLLLLAGSFLVTRIVSGHRPGDIRDSLNLLLAVPLAGAYLLMLVTGAWALIFVEYLQTTFHMISRGNAPAESTITAGTFSSRGPV